LQYERIVEAGASAIWLGFWFYLGAVMRQENYFERKQRIACILSQP
jgi:hypothetical protein